VAKKKGPPELSEYFSQLGKKGGKARLKTMTREERSAIAKKAAAAGSAAVRTNKAAAKKKMLATETHAL
jgi:hypothetical protein